MQGDTGVSKDQMNLKVCSPIEMQPRTYPKRNTEMSKTATGEKIQQQEDKLLKCGEED